MDHWESTIENCLAWSISYSGNSGTEKDFAPRNYLPKCTRFKATVYIGPDVHISISKYRCIVFGVRGNDEFFDSSPAAMYGLLTTVCLEHGLASTGLLCLSSGNDKRDRCRIGLLMSSLNAYRCLTATSCDGVGVEGVFAVSPVPVAVFEVRGQSRSPTEQCVFIFCDFTIPPRTKLSGQMAEWFRPTNSPSPFPLSCISFQTNKTDKTSLHLGSIPTVGAVMKSTFRGHNFPPSTPTRVAEEFFAQLPRFFACVRKTMAA